MYRYQCGHYSESVLVVSGRISGILLYSWYVGVGIAKYRNIQGDV